MKLIADSGSTKTSWKIISPSGETKDIKTPGINPFFRSEEDIYQELSSLLLPETGDDIQQVYFYGAGIVNAEKGEIIRRAINRIYPQATVETYSDVVGAARALFGNQAGIACILGTGSNACLYDGQRITHGISPLGFILGDEGSGAVMGRKLLGDYFKEVMPANLREDFTRQYNLTRDEALNRVYRTEKPNQFLAQFVPFLSAHSNSAYCQAFVQQNFMEFFERNVSKLPGYTGYPIGFIGSVAFHFSQILNNTASYFGYEKTIILKDPIDGLERYYKE
ncbi:MAG TPA: BadF/BadG/BcrA/BcrD ATPase family protein [Prolixibacteraceae bacterium]|nr:BadF/BadG/BcrA/BcrD ATPase family protein [Prolixibacteraceae bacterium]